MRCRTKALGPQVRGLRPVLSVLMAECHNIAEECGDLRLPGWPEVSEGTFVVVYSGPSIKSVQDRTGLPPEGLRGTNALTLEQVEPGEAGKTQDARWLFCSRFCGEKAVCFARSLHPRLLPCLSELRTNESPIPKQNIFLFERFRKGWGNRTLCVKALCQL